MRYPPSNRHPPPAGSPPALHHLPAHLRHAGGCVLPAVQLIPSVLSSLCHQVVYCKTASLGSPSPPRYLLVPELVGRVCTCRRGCRSVVEHWGRAHASGICKCTVIPLFLWGRRKKKKQVLRILLGTEFSLVCLLNWLGHDLKFSYANNIRYQRSATLTECMQPTVSLVGGKTSLVLSVFLNCFLVTIIYLFPLGAQFYM